MNFCTLFDSNYLARGLALYYSLKKYSNNFNLFIYTFDDISFKILKELELENATLIPLEDLEKTELKKVKKDRTITEYMWTSTPFIIYHTIEKFGVESCTYLDSDIYFFNDPIEYLQKYLKNSVIITPHRYSKKSNRLEQSGKYCVQFNYFKNNEAGIKALTWWKDRCLEWCYNKHEDGKFGDQKYLDKFMEKFDGVYETEHIGIGLAPWNVSDYIIQSNDCKVFVLNKTNEKLRQELIFYHFHDLKIYNNKRVFLGGYEFNKDVINLIYSPYLKEINKITQDVSVKFKDVHPNGNLQFPNLTPKLLIINIYRKLITHNYNIYNLNDFN